MRLLETVESLFVVSIFFSLAMCLLAAFSIGTTAEFVSQGTVTAYVGPGVCMVAGLAVLVTMAAYSVPTALRVARATGAKASLRAAYVFMLLPLVYLSVLVGNHANFFLNALAFGWPLFLALAVAVPVASYTLKREASSLFRPVRCHTCTCEFYILFDRPSDNCPYCYKPNWNPFLPENRENPQLAIGGFAPGDARWRGGWDAQPASPAADLRGAVALFLIPASIISVAVGIYAVVEALDWGEGTLMALGLAMCCLGLLGLFAVYLSYIRHSHILGLVTSAGLLAEAAFLFLLMDLLGLVVGLFALVALVSSTRLIATRPRPRARMVRIPKGAGPEE